MALQLRKLMLPSVMNQYRGMRKFSSFCGPFGVGLNSCSPVRVCFANSFVSGRVCGQLNIGNLKLESFSERISIRLLSSGSRKRYTFKARSREVGDSVVLREGKESSLNEGHLDARKQGEPVVAGSSLNELLDVVDTKPSTTRKSPAKTSCKPERRKVDVGESGRKSVQNDKKKRSVTKNNKKTEAAKALVEENQLGIGEEKNSEQSGTSSPSLVLEKSRSSKKSSKAKKATAVDAFHVAKTTTQVLPTGGSNERKGKLKLLYPPSGRSVMVVESLTKAKVIQNYLGDMYEVLPSYGHVRDLAGRSRSVRPDDDFSMVWEVPASAWTHLKSIKVALSGTENLILASDPDREGEAIAWHIIEMLRQQDALNENITVSRVVFHEITESSIKSALQAPRELDSNLVNAYLARRALDYLIGFSISPLLWRKLPGCQSAGRVQSAALGLICDREVEIEQFEPKEYWTVGVEFHVSQSHSLKNRTSVCSLLSHLDSKKLNQLSISSSVEAEAIKERISSSQFKVLAVKTGKVTKNPPMPYITSTLQQDSASKLNFSTTYTMKLAQKLYEGIKLSDKEATGLITYMRTDGLNISNEAANDIHSFVKERYGDKFASKNLRKYFKKVKNAQEAHEAIRPTNIRRLPSSLIDILDDDALKLYTLIWTRTMACQMEPLLIDTVQVDIGSMGEDLVLRSTGSKVGFPGYQAVYKDKEAGVNGNNDKEEDGTQACFDVLRKLKVEDQLPLGEVELRQHHTKPPPRYSEGSLVKKLEELGIGRPSTYASIMKVLQDRNYMTVKNRVLFPEFRGRMVSTFLSHHFAEVADYSFTADMENELDNVSGGVTEWKGLLKDYWSRFSKYCDLATTTDIRQVEKMLEEKFGHILFASLPDQIRVCPRTSYLFNGKKLFCAR
ncbi:putative DNA topoisomerase [Dioscorea sansibarensis]